MEYKILNVEPGASRETLDRAIRRFRAQYHPDKYLNAGDTEKKNAKKLLELGEDAYVSILQSFLPSKQNELSRDNEFEALFRALHPSMAHFAPSFMNWETPLSTLSTINRDNKTVHSFHSSYSYSNVNGVEQESGNINGRQMTNTELEERRNQLNYVFGTVKPELKEPLWRLRNTGN